MAKRRRYRINYKFAIPFALSILLVVGLGIYLISGMFPKYPSHLKNVDTDNKQIGTQMKDLESSDQGYFAYHYPKTGYKTADAFVDTVVADARARNKAEFERSDRKDIEYLQDYAVSTYKNEYLSVTFYQQLDGILTNVESRVFDIKADTELSPKDLLVDKAERKVMSDYRKILENTLPRDQVIAQSTLDGKTNWAINDTQMILFSRDKKVEYNLNEAAHYFDNPPYQTDKTVADIPSAYLDKGINGSEKLIAFTYDDGPHYENTPALIDLFAAYNGNATFFTVGSRVVNHPDLIKQILDSGNQIASHTFTHPNLNNATPEVIQQELASTEQAIRDASGYDGQIMVRPPYGNANEYVRENSDVTFINWSIDSNDWRYKDGNAVCETITQYAHDGGIVLMHDLYSSTVDGTRCALEKLSAEGYRFVTVEELLESRNIPIETKKIYFNA
ncbi:polysaccharide deacetylase family protein [Erysipelothrix anatis]|uniref:polysaccharide deacetylase family protein n=1 Tax=Erysipelothrix anatis TaxID=2683713 RepID=UPI001358B67F|nr:polysaccharide deacetylase family protein [Erysipelothrix anatis]